MALPANRDTIIVDCKVIFVYGRPSPVSIQVNERDDSMVTAVFIIRHGIMCGVQEKLCYICFWKGLFRGEPVIKEADGIMSGSGTRKRKNRKVVFRIRGSEHIQIITKIVAFPVGIPSDVTVRLAVSSVASAVPCTVFQAAADTFFAFLRGSTDWGAILDKGKIKKVNQSIIVCIMGLKPSP